MVLVVLGALIPILWPLMDTTNTDIQAMNGTSTITTFLQTMWPIVLLIIGIGICAGLVFFALRKFGVIGK